MRKLMGFLVATVLMAMLVPPVTLAAEAPAAQEPEVLQGVAGVDATLCRENPEPVFLSNTGGYLCYRCTIGTDCSSLCTSKHAPTGVCGATRDVCIDELGIVKTTCYCS